MLAIVSFCDSDRGVVLSLSSWFDPSTFSFSLSPSSITSKFCPLSVFFASKSFFVKSLDFKICCCLLVFFTLSVGTSSSSVIPLIGEISCIGLMSSSCPSSSSWSASSGFSTGSIFSPRFRGNSGALNA